MKLKARLTARKPLELRITSGADRLKVGIEQGLFGERAA